MCVLLFSRLIGEDEETIVPLHEGFIRYDE